MEKLKWLIAIILCLGIMNAELPRDIKKDIAKLTNDIRKLQYARRNIGFIKCSGMHCLITEEDDTIFDYRNQIFKTLFCNEPDLNDTLFFRMLNYYDDTIFLNSKSSDYWEQKFKKERRKRLGIIVGSVVIVTASMILNVALIRTIRKQ